MDDLELRNLVYAAVRRARAARRPSTRPASTEDALRRLHDEHMIVLEPDRPEIRMANPFSAVPTPYRVEADGRSWFANCAWDAFGIPIALGVDGHVSATCPDCGETLEVDLVAGRRSRTTSSSTSSCPPALVGRHRLHLKHDEPLPVGRARSALAGGERATSPGATMPLRQLGELARAWWGDRLDPDWRPHTREQNQAILDAVGLTGPFWRLP